MKWNEVIYADCMNMENGLPTLEDKSIDLGFTDPPWLIDYSKNKNKDRKYVNGRILKSMEGRIHYKDNQDLNWNLTWFNELERICKGIIIVMAQSQLSWWFRNTDVRGLMILYFKNGTSQSKISKWSRFSPYLFYGDLFRTNKIFSNVIEYVIPWGFLSKEKYIHTTPKGTEIALQLLKDIKPESIIDPFAGSGSYLKAADILGIPWIGYELNEVYSQDINKRFGQIELNKWVDKL